MNLLAPLFRVLIRLFAAPVRFLRFLLGRLYRKTAIVNASEAGAVAGHRASGPFNHGSEIDADRVRADTAHEPFTDRPRRDDITQGGVFFRMMPKPQLSEQIASELTLGTAKTYQKRAEMFYEDAIQITPPGGLFYEEVERAHIERALGVDEPLEAHTFKLASPVDDDDVVSVEHTVPREEVSLDRRFSDTTAEFRETFNTNSRRLMFFYVPFLFLFVLAYLYLYPSSLYQSGQALFDGIAQYRDGTVTLASIDFGPLLVGLVVIALVYVLYQWPYRVCQQIISLNINNYISQKFGRMSQHFQVAKRQALNVERNARMRHADQLKDDAGTWAVAYNWIAMRLMFCEVLIRNTLFQIRRNTVLYKLLGIATCFGLAGSLIVVQSLLPSALFVARDVSNTTWFVEVSVVTVLFVAIVYGLVIQQPFSLVRQSFDEQGWHRFNSIRLDATVAEHVGEDKLQIITFRDRNRME